MCLHNCCPYGETYNMKLEKCVHASLGWHSEEDETGYGYDYLDLESRTPQSSTPTSKVTPTSTSTETLKKEKIIDAKVASSVSIKLRIEAIFMTAMLLLM